MKQWKQIFLTLGLFVFLWNTAVLQAKSKNGKQKIENKKAGESKNAEGEQRNNITKSSKEGSTKSQANGETKSKRDWSADVDEGIEVGRKSVVEDVKGIFDEIGGF